MQRIEINGIKIYPFTSRDELIDYVDKNKGILVAINARKIHSATDETRKIINNNIGYADGIAAVKVLKQKGIKNAVKIPGCELWLDIIRKHHADKSFYLIGATEEIINKTVSKLKTEFSDINILGYRNGYFNSNEEKKKTIDDVIEKKPDVVFIAMGSPAQELLMGEMLKKHPAIYQGLGGSFKVYCGEEKRAPKWVIDHNLEGFYRFLLNPRERFQRVIKGGIFLLKLKFKK